MKPRPHILNFFAPAHWEDQCNARVMVSIPDKKTFFSVLEDRSEPVLYASLSNRWFIVQDKSWADAVTTAEMFAASLRIYRAVMQKLREEDNLR